MASILFRAYKQGMYFLLPSITSIISSYVASHFSRISALFTRYSFRIALMHSSLTLSVSTILEIVIPPLSFLLNSISGGLPLSLIPKPSS